MYRLAVFKILSAKNVIDEVLTASVIAVNTAKIIEVYDAPQGAAIKLETSPRHDGYIYVAETRQQVLSFFGYQKEKELSLSKSNNSSIILDTNDIYYAYPKDERVKVVYYNGTRMVSVSLKMTFVNFVREYNNINNITLDSLVVGGVEDNISIDENGNMTLHGDATVWDDIRIVPSIWDVPGLKDPDQISYQPTGVGASFTVYGFAKDDQGWFTIQMPHSYKEGSTMYAHVHWTPGSRGNEEVGHVVQWRLDYTFASINGTFPASQTIGMPDTCDGLDDKHQMTPEVAISGTGIGISSQMIGRIYRYNHASDTWAGVAPNLPLFLEFDIHYEIDALGSKTSSAK